MDNSKGTKNNKISNLIFLLILIIFSTPFTDFSSKIAQIINIVLFVIVSIYLAMNFNKSTWILLQNKLFLIFICYLPFNIMLAFNKETTILYTIKLVGLFLVGICIALKTSFEDWIKILLTYFGLITLASIIVSTFFPQIGVHSDFPHVGSWKGIVGHKNTLGTLCVLSIVTYLISIFGSKKYLIVKLTIITLNLYTIVKANSKTAFVMLAILFIIFVIYSVILMMQKKNIYLTISISIFIFILIGFLLCIVLLNIDDILALMGRDRTLTGRTNIYSLAYNFIKERLFFGYGYGGFWNTDTNMRKLIWEQIGLEIVSSHSGILDLLLDFGIVGSSILIVIFIFYFLQSFFFSFSYKSNIIMTFPLIYFLFIIGNNITDSRFLTGRSIYWLIFLVTAFIVRKYINENKKSSL